ncbi:MAG TPA: Fur family transcriptional regulator [Verrucomicrobiae bacterium]|nr:Fur family transcriptional regulator [Verrucomicrobiae bacterium]
MSSKKQDEMDASLNKRLATSGFRFTPQRQHVYNVLLQKRDHPTVEEVFIRSKEQMPDISMATVYNCLDALVKCGLVRHVNLERSATRYCPNMKEHCHFYCDDCGGIFDVDFSPSGEQGGLQLPEGFKVKQFDISIRGTCPSCAGPKAKP